MRSPAPGQPARDVVEQVREAFRGQGVWPPGTPWPRGLRGSIRKMPDGGRQEQRGKITWGQGASTWRLPLPWAGTSRGPQPCRGKAWDLRSPKEEDPKTSLTPGPAADHSFGQPKAIKAILKNLVVSCTPLSKILVHAPTGKQKKHL